MAILVSFANGSTLIQVGFLGVIPDPTLSLPIPAYETDLLLGAILRGILAGTLAFSVGVGIGLMPKWKRSSQNRNPIAVSTPVI